MENIIDIATFNEKVRLIKIKVNDNDYKIVIKKLLLEKEKIVNYLYNLKEQGKIKSIFRPKNKQIQKELNELIKAKKTIKKAIEKIKEIYS